MTIPMNVKLGKLAPKLDPRTLQLETYFYGNQPPPAPPSENWATKVVISSAMGNTDIGDCTCATMGYLIETMTSDEGSEVVVPVDAVISAYSAISGYDPITGQGDVGATCLAALKYWQKVGVDNHKIMAYVALRPTHPNHLKAACFIFGNVYLGIEMPLSAQAQTGGIWDVPAEGLVGDGAPGSWGGHACPLVSYGPQGGTCITWGFKQQMTWRFIESYCSEAYTVLSPDFMNPSKISASGFNLSQLESDLHKVMG